MLLPLRSKSCLSDFRCSSSWLQPREVEVWKFLRRGYFCPLPAGVGNGELAAVAGSLPRLRAETGDVLPIRIRLLAVTFRSSRTETPLRFAAEPKPLGSFASATGSVSASDFKNLPDSDLMRGSSFFAVGWFGSFADSGDGRFVLFELEAGDDFAGPNCASLVDAICFSAVPLCEGLSGSAGVVVCSSHSVKQRQASPQHAVGQYQIRLPTQPQRRGARRLRRLRRTSSDCGCLRERRRSRLQATAASLKLPCWSWVRLVWRGDWAAKMQDSGGGLPAAIAAAWAIGEAGAFPEAIAAACAIGDAGAFPEAIAAVCLRVTPVPFPRRSLRIAPLVTQAPFLTRSLRIAPLVTQAPFLTRLQQLAPG